MAVGVQKQWWFIILLSNLMTETIDRQGLPKIASKRAQTEGNQPKYRHQRFSFQIQTKQ
jgi:hypothetical protein